MDHQAFAQLLGNYGEFIGAIVVVLTLGYLTLQVRQNTTAIRQQSYNNILERRAAILQSQAEDRDIFELIAQGIEGKSFDSIDAGRFTFFFINYFSHVQDCYLQFRAGIVEREVWEAEVRIISPAFRRPGLQSWWKVSQQYFVPEFIAALEEQVQEVELVQFDPETSTWYLGGEFPGGRGASKTTRC